MPTTNYPFLAAISLLIKDEINESPADLQNTEALTDIAFLGGRYVRSDQPIYHTYVNQDHFIQPEISAITTNAAALIDVTFTAGTSGYIRKSDQIKFANGRTGIVYSVTRGAQDSATIKMNDNAAITVAVGNKLGIISRARGAGRTAAETLRFSLTKYYNLIQSFDEGYKIDNVANASTLRIKVKGKDTIYVRDHWVTAIKHKAEVNAAMIGGTISTTLASDTSPNLVDPDVSTPIQTTRGLDQYCSTYGSTDTVATPGTYVLQDLADMIAKLLSKKADVSQYMGVCGTATRIALDNLFKNLGSGGVTSVRLNIGGRDVDMMVDQVSYGGMVLDLKTMPLFNHPAFLSQTDIVKSLYFIPKYMCPVEGGGMQDRFRMRYTPHGVRSNASGFGGNLANDIWAEWYTGANAPTGPTSDENVWMTNWLTNQGLEVIGAEHYGVQKVLA